MAASKDESSKDETTKKPAPRVEMRRRREELGYTQEKAAEALGVSLSSVKGWEDGTRNARIGIRPRIARFLMVSRAQVQRWFEGDDTRPQRIAVSDWLGHFASLEQDASRIWTFQTIGVPGLLQTADYAAAVVAVRPDMLSEAEVSRTVEVRLARQQVLTRAPEPLELVAIVDESVLLRRAVGPDIMAAQLDHLVELADWPNIELQVLPLDSGAFPFGSFTVLGSSDSGNPYMACVQDYGGMHYLERERGLESHVRLVEHLREVALRPAASADLIAKIARERYR